MLKLILNNNFKTKNLFFLNKSSYYYYYFVYNNQIFTNFFIFTLLDCFFKLYKKNFFYFYKNNWIKKNLKIAIKLNLSIFNLYENKIQYNFNDNHFFNYFLIYNCFKFNKNNKNLIFKNILPIFLYLNNFQYFIFLNNLLQINLIFKFLLNYNFFFLIYSINYQSLVFLKKAKKINKFKILPILRFLKQKNLLEFNSFLL